MVNHLAIRRTLATAVASAVCLLLTSCSDDSEPVNGPEETSGSPVSSALTAPAASLEFGEPATVPIGEDGIARLTVTRIEPGRADELTAFGKDAKATVSYVWIEVSRVSGDVSIFTSYDHIHGWAGDDLVPHVLTDPKPYAPCPTRYFPNNGPVDVLETCTVFTSATPIDRVGFHDDGEYQRNEDEIVWR